MHNWHLKDALTSFCSALWCLHADSLSVYINDIIFLIKDSLICLFLDSARIALDDSLLNKSTLHFALEQPPLV